MYEQHQAIASSQPKLRVVPPANVMLLLIVLGIVIGAGILNLFFPSHKIGLPGSVLSRVKGFQPYYLKSSYSTDFMLQPKTATYSSGVLVFEMKNAAGKSLAWTEQAIPPHFEPPTVSSASPFNTEYGQGMVVSAPDRTTGSFFTQDKTWIIINAPSPIGAGAMQQILQAISPAPSP